jgi:hypothetical protein
MITVVEISGYATCISRGQKFCEEEMAQMVPVRYEEVASGLKNIYIGFALGLVSVIFLTGPSADCNLGHWSVKRLPPSLSPTWLKDQEGNVKLSGVGEFWLYWAAISSIHVTLQAFYFTAAQNYVKYGMTSIM